MSGGLIKRLRTLSILNKNAINIAFAHRDSTLYTSLN